MIQGLALDPTGNVVALLNDIGARRIETRKYDLSGRTIWSLELPAWWSDSWGPSVAAATGDILIGSRSSGTAYRIDSAGKSVEELDLCSECALDNGVAVDPFGRMLVLRGHGIASGLSIVESNGTETLTVEGKIWSARFARNGNIWLVPAGQLRVGGRVLWQMPTSLDVVELNASGDIVSTHSVIGDFYAQFVRVVPTCNDGFLLAGMLHGAMFYGSDSVEFTAFVDGQEAFNPFIATWSPTEPPRLKLADGPLDSWRLVGSPWGGAVNIVASACNGTMVSTYTADGSRAPIAAFDPDQCGADSRLRPVAVAVDGSENNTLAIGAYLQGTAVLAGTQFSAGAPTGLVIVLVPK